MYVGLAYHKNINAKVERTNGVLCDTLRAFANGRKSDCDRQLPLAGFAINNAASVLGDHDGLTQFLCAVRTSTTASQANAPRSTSSRCVKCTWEFAPADIVGYERI